MLDKEASKDAVDVFKQAEKLGKTLNFGNILEGPYEGSWGIIAEEHYFSLIKEQGFDSLRVPIRFSNKTLKDAPYTIDENFFMRIDWVIEQALLNDLNVIVDLHHFDEMLEDPAGHKDRFLSIWQQIATRYQEQPLSVYYEILNEPHTKITPAIWNNYLLEAIDVIRSIDTTRTLIVGGGDWNSIDGLYKLELPEHEQNIIATFHYYGPMLFTHQGAEWMEPEYQTRGVVWPGPPPTPVEPVEAATKVNWVNSFFRNYNDRIGAANPASEEALVRDLERAAKWGVENNRPLFLGEFGVYSSADKQSRILWTKKVRTEAERLGMSWAYWEFAAGFGLYNRSTATWDQSMLDALFEEAE